MEASILEEEDAEYALEASETIFEIYAAILEGLTAYRASVRTMGPNLRPQ